MEELTNIAEQIWLDNYIWQYATFALLIILGLIFKSFFSKLIGRIIFRFFKKHKDYIQAETFIKLMKKPISLLLMLIILFIAFSLVSFPDHWQMAPKEEFGLNMILYRAFTILLISSFIWAFLRSIDFIAVLMINKAEKNNNAININQVIPFFADGSKIIIIIFGTFFIMGSVFKVNVGTLIAGLGIGGLALALAARESLENLIGSFTIFLDKPFVVGDFIKVGDLLGVVEKIGFRSTRIRTLEKSYVTMPNKKMVDQELDNLSLRTFRRAMFNIRVTYATSKDQIKAIIKDIQEHIDNHPKTNQDGKVHFTDFNNSSLDIMVLFFVDTNDWGEFLAVKQEINYKIMDIVKEHNASFAFPSTSVYIEKQDDSLGD